MVINIKAAVTRRYDCTIEMIARLIIIGLPHTMNNTCANEQNNWTQKNAAKDQKKQIKIHNQNKL